MRDRLKPLEGKQVVVVGRLSAYNRQPDGTVHACLAGCKVRPLSDRPLREIKPVHIDHLWIVLSADNKSAPSEMLTRQEMAGTVGYYSRGNGSIDLTVKVYPGGGAPLHRIWDKVQNSWDTAEALSWMRGALSQAEKGAPVWCWSRRPSEVLDAIKEGIARYERSTALNMGAQMVAPANGPCHRMRAADPFTNLRRRSRKEAAA